MKLTVSRKTSWSLLKTGILAGAIWGATTLSSQAQWWTYLENQGTPITSNVYLGDNLTNIIKFAVNQGTSGWTVQFGMGTTVNGSSWEWAAATWDRTESPNNFWKSVANSLRFKATGTVYYSGRFTYGGRTEYASAGWTQGRTTLSASSYFTVKALTAPSGQGATAVDHTKINLTWTRGVSGTAKNTMIVRSTSSTFTAPTQGAAYAVNANLGAGTVIYNGAATAFSDTGLSESTRYYYAFYAVNNDYYSAAVTKDATTPAAPLVQPSVQSSNIGMNNSERQDQLTPVWTAGSGARRIVVARLNAAPTGAPADGADYSATANANFSAAPALGDGKVVFAGTGNTFTITGLSADSTYYFRVYEYNGTGASTLYLTTTATGNPASGQTLGPPTGLGATPNSVTPESQLDLNWTKNNGKNVIIVRSTSSTFTAPTQGSSYNTGATLGSGTVVYKGAATAATATSLTPATTYYFAFYSENYNYYSAAGTASGLPMPIARNTGGGASPGSPAGALYLGDTGTFTVDAQAKIGINWSASRILLSSDNNVDGSDPASAWVGYTDQPGRSLTSPRFFKTGILYWAIQLDYGSPYNDTFWYKSSSAAWAPESVNGNGSTLTVTVSPLNTPTAQSATPAGPQQINLAWTRGISGSAKNTIVVRSTSSTFTEPTQGSAYSSGNMIGDGTVVFLGTGTSMSDSGLPPGATYYYAFYAENYSYYSPAVTASATLPGIAPSVQATSVTSAGNTHRLNQLTFSWTSGNGARRIAVAREAAAPTGAPVDGVDYSAATNNDFSAAPALGNGKIVYDGTGNSFVLTGLNPDTVYYVQVFEYNGSGSETLYLTTSASGNPDSAQTLGAPTNLSATLDGSNPSTGLSLNWTKNNGKNAMIVRSTISTFTAPTQGSSYNTGATLGSGTIIYNGSSTTTAITGLTPGTTYYFAFYSESYSYYSPANITSITTEMPLARNTGGLASPGAPSGTLYLGDNAVFTAEAQGMIESNWSRQRVWLSADANVGLGPDAVLDWIANFQNGTARTVTSPRFFQTGTLYWAMQFDYGSPYNDPFWYKSSSAAWTQQSTDGSGSTLTVTVSPLNTPTSPQATATSGGQINLAWTKGVSGSAKNTLIVRSTSSTFTAPTQGSAYSTGASLGDGIVVFNGSAATKSDTGLSAATTYYYAFYAENYSYYSAAVTASDTTDSIAAPASPVATDATSPDWWSSFQANWNAVAGADGYRLDVSTAPNFNGEWVLQDIDVGNVTNRVVTNLVIGQYFYRVRAYNVGGDSPNSNVKDAELGTAAGRNKSGGTPYYTPATIYVGDKATFGADTWGTILGNYGAARAVIDTDKDISIGGLGGDWTGFDNVEYTEAESPRFTSAGTWYWGIQMNYGSPYGTNFWMVRDKTDWDYLQYKGTNGNLTVTVLALGNPSSVSAAQDGSDPQHQINLSWTRWSSKAVMVVRSTTSNFTTPSPGSAYVSGNMIGSGRVIYRGSTATTVSDTGLTPGLTYYYRFYTENWSYYSAGDDANANTTPGCDNGTAPTMAHPGNKVIYANNASQLNFNILASDTPGCNAPTFVVSELPAGASFNSMPSGNTMTGSFSWTPQTSQVGTYPIRFTATDSENLSTSVVVKLIVGIGSPQEGNTGGIPNSQYNWAVAITNIDVDLVGNASVIYRSTNGMAYDVYQSDSVFGGGMSWSRVDANRIANGNIDSSDQNYSGARRYFQVVPAGSAPTTNGVWGVIRPSIVNGWNLLSPPLASDLKFNGAFGENLALGLTGAGTQAGSDQLHGLDGSGNPFVLWINSNDNNRWYESTSPATRTLNPGQGFMIYRQGGQTTLPLIGPVGNTGNSSFTLKSGQWTMFGLSQGKNLTGNPLPGSLSSQPIASFQYDSADVISVLNPNGSWKNYQRFGNNLWLDLQTMQQSSSIQMQPGDGFYYYRQPGSDMAIGF